MADNSADSIVTDPPYGLSFMGKKWDYDVPGVDVWAECLRVLKPGGHLLAFAGTRTQHRMAVRIEDAGFEIRDMIAWIYGSGFPKSLDVSKAIDKAARGRRVVALIQALIEEGHNLAELGKMAGIPSLESSFRDWTTGGHRPEERSWDRLLFGLGFSEAEGLNVISRRKVTIGGGTAYTFREGEARDYEIKVTAPATEAAKQWEGWGTALKPALEPITVARKPLIGTVAENVLEHGTGGLNIDGCRVAGVVPQVIQGGQRSSGGIMNANGGERGTLSQPHDAGRWPANLIHDGSDEVLGLFPQSKDGVAGKRSGVAHVTLHGLAARNDVWGGYGGDGSAARFFYCAKSSKRDRDEGLEGFATKQSVGGGGGVGDYLADVDSASGKFGSEKAPAKNFHPTVKPTDLMRYLCRLVTPPGGVVLDPFMGSGSTGKAAMLEGFRFVGIEREAEYLAIARARIEAATTPEPKAEKTKDLFEGTE
jgi:site-specific DNA-methyltransferase (adenine-specific)